METEVGKSYHVEIERLTIGGDALCRIDGKVCFVPYGVPGDKLLIKIIESKKDFFRGEIIKVLTPSAFRRTAPCPSFGVCGGCSWQHIDHASQEKFKHELVEDLLRRKLPDQKFEFLPLVSSPQEFQYRNRITLKYDGTSLGYYQKRSHNLIQIEHCLLAEKEINDILPKIREELHRNQKLRPSKTEKASEIENIRIFKTADGKVSWKSTQEDIPATGFSQVNSAQNEQLIKTVLDWAQKPASNTLYDFYSGSGNFTFPLYDLHKFEKVLSVEADPELTQLGKILRGKRNRIKFITAKVEDFLSHQDLEPDSLVLLDPPRGGCDESVINALASSKAQQIIYISCHPASLARDLERLSSSKAGEKFTLNKVQCFDMFPQTDHVETVAEFLRR